MPPSTSYFIGNFNDPCISSLLIVLLLPPGQVAHQFFLLGLTDSFILSTDELPSIATGQSNVPANSLACTCLPSSFELATCTLIATAQGKFFFLQLVRHKDTPRAKDSTPWLLSPLFGMARLAFCYCMIHLLLSAFYLIFTVKTLQQLQDGNATPTTGRAVLSSGAVRPISWHLTNLLCKFMFVPLCLASIPTLMLSLCACSFGHSADKMAFLSI